MKHTTQEIADLLQGTLIGNGSIELTGITNIDNPKQGFITFINDPKYLEALEQSDISCIIVPRSISESKKTIIQSDNPKLAFARLLQRAHPARTFDGAVSKNAYIAGTVSIGNNVTVQDYVYIEEGSSIGNNTVIMAGCYIGRNVTIGDNTILRAHVAIQDDCIIGNNVSIFPNSVIGSDGFGYVYDGEKLEKLPQIGNVIIEDNVEIGSCTTIDRAAMGSTIIHKGVKLDNLVQVAHNVEIGEHTAASSFTGISGSCKIGKHCTLAGNVGLGDHVTLGNNVTLAGNTALPSGKKVKDGQVMLGAPGRPIEQAMKQFGAIAVLPKIIEKVKKMEARIKELEEKS